MPSLLRLSCLFPTHCAVTYSAGLFQRSGTIRFLVPLLVLGAWMIPIPSFAWTYYLQEDLGVQGLVHLCRYGNGKVYTVNAIDLCPISIQDSAPGFGQGQGFLQGEYQDGITKVCVYDVLGEKKAIRLPSTSLCPLDRTF